jgi:hypothetical protein
MVIFSKSFGFDVINKLFKDVFKTQEKLFVNKKTLAPEILFSTNLKKLFFPSEEHRFFSLKGRQKLKILQPDQTLLLFLGNKQKS